MLYQISIENLNSGMSIKNISKTGNTIEREVVIAIVITIPAAIVAITF